MGKGGAQRRLSRYPLGKKKMEMEPAKAIQSVQRALRKMAINEKKKMTEKSDAKRQPVPIRPNRGIENSKYETLGRNGKSRITTFPAMTNQFGK